MDSTAVNWEFKLDLAACDTWLLVEITRLSFPSLMPRILQTSAPSHHRREVLHCMWANDEIKITERKPFLMRQTH
jgi:hypothetical protein